MTALTDIRGFLIDMDGVLLRGEQALPGARELIRHLRSRGIPFLLVTNNSTRSPASVQDQLNALGIEVDRVEVLTTANGTAAYMKQTYPELTKVFLIGERALRDEMSRAGFEIVETGEGVQAVVVGMDRNLGYRRLEEAAYALARDIPFIGTNPDNTFPTERGLAPGNGSILAALKAATGRTPIIYGKPQPHLFQTALSLLAIPADRVLVLGDRLETDILGGHRAGMQTCLVLTGVTNQRSVSQSSIQPIWTFNDLLDFFQALDWIEG